MTHDTYVHMILWDYMFWVKSMTWHVLGKIHEVADPYTLWVNSEHTFLMIRIGRSGFESGFEDLGF